MMSVTKMIIDTDPGIDDAMAIYTAIADPEIELLGLTTVFGNVHVEQATRNALYLLETLDVDVAVAQGADKPLEVAFDEPPAHIHGKEGFGDYPAFRPNSNKIDLSAAEYLCKVCSENPNEVVVCAIGPLTNLATALRLDPSIASNVKKVIVMGGAVRTGGNITPHAEANVYHDPHAAAEVFAADWDVVLVGLDVTHEVLCSPKDFQEIADASEQTGKFVKDISEYYLRFYESVGKYGSCSLHDPTAIIAANRIDLFKTERITLDVILLGERQGHTFEKTDGPKVNVCLEVDSDTVKKRFIDLLGSLK